jgi:osmotically-inducible protein OsmY
VSDQELIDRVKEELRFDPRVDDDAVAVSADDGVVTMRGTVGSFHQKRDARSAVERVAGVTGVENELKVRLLDGDGRADADLRGDVLQALMLDAQVPETVEVSVDDGFVRLSGTAEWKYQRDEAERVASRVRGVLDVWDDVVLTGPPPNAHDVHHDIKKALERNAKLDAESLTVETSDRTVTLKGTVSSWAEHDEAVATAWSAPGVQKVRDHILVAG